MSYIIKGILDRKLPWALVLLGVMIAVMLEMSGISSLAFAVGVYLPLASSAPLFFGGMVRWFVDRAQRKRLRGVKLSEEQLNAEADKSPGVLLSSGYIAGGALAGIAIAYMAAATADFSDAVDKWSTDHNPFYSTAAWNAWGPQVAEGSSRSDLLTLLPFLALIVFLYLVGRETLLKEKAPSE